MSTSETTNSLLKSSLRTRPSSVEALLPISIDLLSSSSLLSWHNVQHCRQVSSAVGQLSIILISISENYVSRVGVRSELRFAIAYCSLDVTVTCSLYDFMNVELDGLTLTLLDLPNGSLKLAQKSVTTWKHYGDFEM